MLEIIAQMKPVQLKESSVNDAIDTPKIKVTDCINGQLIKHKTQPHTAFRFKWSVGIVKFEKLATHAHP